MDEPADPRPLGRGDHALGAAHVDVLERAAPRLPRDGGEVDDRIGAGERLVQAGAGCHVGGARHHADRPSRGAGVRRARRRSPRARPPRGAARGGFPTNPVAPTIAIFMPSSLRAFLATVKAHVSFCYGLADAPHHRAAWHGRHAPPARHGRRRRCAARRRHGRRRCRRRQRDARRRLLQRLRHSVATPSRSSGSPAEGPPPRLQRQRPLPGRADHRGRPAGRPRRDAGQGVR